MYAVDRKQHLTPSQNYKKKDLQYKAKQGFWIYTIVLLKGSQLLQSRLIKLFSIPYIMQLHMRFQRQSIVYIFLQIEYI